MTVTVTEDGDVLVHVDCSLKSGGTRRYFAHAAEGDRAPGPGDEPPFARILGQAFRWRDLLVSGAYGGKTALARALGVDKANLIASLRLPYLSPVIVEKALSGELGDASSRRYRKLSSPFWYDQHRALGIG